MDRQQREYNAILEQVTREASLQAELDIRARAQAEAVRNYSANILNRLDIQARLGSRVAPIEEPTRQLRSRLVHGSSGLHQQLPARSQPLLQPYLHSDQPAEHNLSGYSSLSTRATNPLPLMVDHPRGTHNFRTSLRNHSPVQHGSFADDFYPQESFQPQVDHPARPLINHPSDVQQRMALEVHQERRTLLQDGSSYQKSNRSLIRPPISSVRQPIAQKNQASPPASRLVGSLHVNASNRSSSNSPSSSTNKKVNVIGGSDLNKKKVLLQARDKPGYPGKTPVKTDAKSAPVPTKTPPVTAKTPTSGRVEKDNKKESPVESKNPKAKTTLPSERKVPSLFGPPPSAPAYKDANQKSNSPKSTTINSSRGNAVEIVESLPPKPLMDLIPSLSVLPFSNSAFSESNLQSGSAAVSTVKFNEEKSSGTQSEPTIPPEPLLNTGKPVPLLDITPVPLFDVKPVSLDTKNTSQSPNAKGKSPVILIPSPPDESKASEPKVLEVKSKHTVNKEDDKESPLHAPLSKEAAKEKSGEQIEAKDLSISGHTKEIIDLEESHDVARPLWYTSPDSLCLQSAGATSALTGDIEQNCGPNEVEEGEIIGESLSDEMEIIETKYQKTAATDVIVVMPPEVTGESSGIILKRFYAAPEEFIHFLPFPGEASEENVKSVEKCWQQLLILRSLTTKQRRPYSQKILSRIKAHFAQGKIRPTNSLTQFCFKVWSHIATYLGEYLQQRLDSFIRGLVHRSMIDFILIHMHKKKMPRSLKNASLKAQINLLYIFSLQGFTNATNNYMVKWLLDELEKVGIRVNVNTSSVSHRLDMKPAVASAHLNGLVLDDQLIEKKFCLVEYLKVKSFSDPKEEEQCVRVCTLLKCQDYIPNTEWKYDKAKSSQASKPPDNLMSKSTAAEQKGLITVKSDVARNKEVKPVSKVSDRTNKSTIPKPQDVDNEPSNQVGSQKAALQSDGASELEKEASVPSAPSGSEKNDKVDLKHGETINLEYKTVNIQEPVATTSSASGTNQIVKTDNNEIIHTADNKENVSITIPEIEVTPVKTSSEVSNNNSIEKQHLASNYEPFSKKKGGHSRKLHSDTAGKWRSYMVEGNSSASRIVSRRRRQDMVHHGRKHFGRHRAHSSSVGRNQLSNRSSSSERSHHSDGNKAVDSDSDSEDLETMMLRKNALLSLWKASMTKKGSGNSDSKKIQAKEKDKLVKKPQQTSLDFSAGKLAVEQISDTEGNASPKAYSIAESGIVLVSLGTDNVVSFPSQYNTTGSVPNANKPVQSKINKDDHQIPVEKQNDTTTDERMEVSTVATELKPSEEATKSSSEATAAYYKASTGNNDQKKAEKGKQSFVIRVTSEDSDSDETDIDKTTPHSTVTSGTSSPMPMQQEISSTPTRKDLEDLIQLYKRRAKEKEVAPMKNDQGALKSPDAIRIMPRPKQDEYHLLKEQIAQLEKKKKERKTANKRKATAPPENQAKRFKPYVSSKEDTSSNLPQQTETADPKKEVEYQTNIAVCEVQLEELKITIDRGYSDVMKLNKQLNDCVSEIEEHTMKLQLLNKQLKIAKDSLELAQARQQEIKNKVKVAQNNLLKDKSSLAVVEGELTHFRSQLAKLQKQSQQKPTPQHNDNQVSTNSPLKFKEKKTDVVDITDEPKEFVASSSSTVQQTALPSDNVQSTSSNVVIIPNSACATIKIASLTSGCTDKPPSLSTKLNSKVTKEAKVKPGQKIANVVKKLSQEHHVHTPNPPSTVASNNGETADQVEDKSSRRSLDAVVAKLHIVKKQEFDKQFQVDLGLGSGKQARENTKLDSVVEKLVAKQSQSQLLCDYPVHFETVPNKSAKTDAVVDSSMHCMEADVSSTVPDIFEIGMQRKSTVMDPSNSKSAFQSIAYKDTDKPVIMFGIADGEQEKRQRESVSNPVTRQGMQTKLPIRPKIIQVETAHTHTATNSGVKSGVIQLRNENQADAKEGDMATNSCLSEGVPITFEAPSSQHKQMLAKVNKFIIETFNVKPKVLECLPGKDDSRDILNDTMCGSLTDFYAVNSTVCVQQESSFPGATFVKLLQPVQEPPTVSSSAASSFSTYRSPLSCFKSYRLHPYYRTRAKLAVSSTTYSNKISPNKIMCKFNMTGKCSDKNCMWQHWNETQMSSNELFSDVVSYAPDLAMVTNDDDVSTAQSKIRTRTSNVVSSLGRRMTADEIGVYLVDQVANSCDSRTFNARIEGRIPMKLSSSAESSASIQRPKSFTSDFKAVFDSTYSQLGTLGQTPIRNSSTQQSDRYFECVQASSEVDSSCDPKAVVLSVRESLLQDQNENTENVHKCAITLLEAALRTNPHEEILWIELMRIHARTFVKLPVDQMSLSLFLTVCHKAIKTTDSYNLFQECISLLPTYEVKSKWYAKGYEMVKLKMNEKEKSIQCLELFLGSVVLDYMTGYTVEAIEKMKFSLRLKECQSHYPFKDLLDHLTCDDLLLFWMVYIYYCHSHAFPACVIETTASSGCRILDKKTFIVQWKEGERLSALYNNFIQLFKMALKHCKLVYTIKYPLHTSAVYALQFQNLFENLILLEYKCGNLEAAKISIRKVLSVHPSYLGMWLLLADVVVKCGYTEGYKEVYVEAENILRGNVEFYYIVARKLYQQGDSNEAMSWLTSCVHSKYTGKCLNATKYDVILHYRKLLRQPVPYHFQTSTIVSESDTHHTPYLWLCYCLYVELAGVPSSDNEYWPTTEDTYEAAVHSVHSPDEVNLVWKAYLTYLRSSATSRSAEASNWKQFLDGINRAFQVVDPKDHNFQIEVVDMCIAALPADYDDKALGLYNHWIKMFPYNKELVCRCSDAAMKLDHVEMAQNVLATYLTNHSEDWNTWKKAIDIEVKLNNVKEVRWMFWEASKSSLFNIFLWKEFLKFELRQSIVTEDTHQVTTVLQQCNHLGINLTKLVS